MAMGRRKIRKLNIRRSRMENRMPRGLILAELFIIVMCISYVFKITGTMMDIAVDDSIARRISVCMVVYKCAPKPKVQPVSAEDTGGRPPTRPP